MINDAEIEALAVEIAEREHLSYDQARDAAALDLAGLGRYAESWNAERYASWRELRRFAKWWDLRAAVIRARGGTCSE